MCYTQRIPRETKLQLYWRSFFAMANLPTGTLTFLFSDIEDSSRLWEQYPHAMMGAVARHEAILGEAIGARGGAVFKTVGDGCHAVFQRATDAVAAALDAQRALVAEAWEAFGLPSTECLRVRMAFTQGWPRRATATTLARRSTASPA